MATILVIDDDEQSRAFLRDVLEFAGYEVYDACDGRQGISCFRQSSIDLVITDIVMPEQEGLETIIALRREQPGIHIIALSGGGARNNLDYLVSANMLGAERTFAKPCSRKELLEAIESLLGPAVAKPGQVSL
jgi:DNA-binding response OmpR family regulator